MNATDVLREFVQDCEAAYPSERGMELTAAGLSDEWPDLASTYLHAKDVLNAPQDKLNHLGMVLSLLEQISEEVSARLNVACEVHMSFYPPNKRVRIVVLGGPEAVLAVMSEAAAPFTTVDLLVETLVATANVVPGCR